MFSYLLNNSKKGTKKMAEDLEVDPRTIRLYKAKVLSGQLNCEGTVACPYRKASSNITEGSTGGSDSSPVG